MNIYKTIEEMPKFEEAFLTIGNFDGIHLGHRKILRTMIEEAGPAQKIVLTFREAPLKLLKPELFPGVIMPTPYKERWMESHGIDSYFDLHLFDVMPMSAENFIEFLLSKIRHLHVYVGFNFRFGHGNIGDVTFLEKQSLRHGFELRVFDKVLKDGKTVDSTSIRRLIQSGDVETASQLLDRPYFYIGRKIKGDGIGKKIDFPTLNLSVGIQVLPANGSYFSYLIVKNRFLPAMSYIGTRPTVNGKEKRFETHVLNFNEKLNDETYTVALIKKINEEKTFHNLEELKDFLYNNRHLCLSLVEKTHISKDFYQLINGGKYVFGDRE